MMESRRLVASYGSPDNLRDAFVRHIDANDVEAFVLFRELDYFEQLGAMEQHGGFDFGLIESAARAQARRPVRALGVRRSTSSAAVRCTRTSCTSRRRCGRRSPDEVRGGVHVCQARPHGEASRRATESHDADAGGDPELLAAKAELREQVWADLDQPGVARLPEAGEPDPQLRGRGSGGAAGSPRPTSGARHRR